jgi:hypothetical protein
VAYLDSAASILFTTSIQGVVIKYESMMAFRDLLREIEDEKTKIKKKNLKTIKLQ